jgi:hypothetical protein
VAGGLDERNGTLDVTCPSGDVAISGGASFGPGNGTGLDNVWIETSRPDPVSGTPAGWFVIINNATSQTGEGADRDAVLGHPDIVGVSSLAQCRHLVALAGTSPDWQSGQTRVGCGSPKTSWPRLRM